MPDRRLHVSRSGRVRGDVDRDRHPLLMACAVSVATAIGVGLVVVLWQRRPRLRQLPRLSELWISRQLARHRDALPAATLHRRLDPDEAAGSVSLDGMVDER